MDSEKAGLPPYSAVGSPEWPRRRRAIRRSRGLRVFALICLAFIVYAQWKQINPQQPTSKPSSASTLSIKKLEDDLKLCSKLRSKPKDPIGLGRDRNARYIDGHKPTLIRNATIWVGEPAEDTSAEDARAGKGYAWVNGDVFLEHGLIKQVGTDIDANSLSSDTIVWDAKGRRLTTGIIDMHSHSGVISLPELNGNGDGNEMSADITPFVRSIDGLNPNDHQIQVIKSGGVTTSLILPGSANNMGGEAFVIKHAVGKLDGRNETSAADMLADPDRNWRYMKMACGENAKNVGRHLLRSPLSRLGEAWEFRHAFEQARNLVQAQDDWCAAAEVIGVQTIDTYLPQDLKWESLSAALRGQVHINTHCYTIPDLESFVSHTNEFKFAVRAFHHAHQTYLVPEILKRAWGDTPPASALFADNMWYKAESYVGSEYAGKILYENGLTPIYVSDNPVLNAQHVIFEAAKAFGYGLPYHAAMASVTSAPAERLGLGERIGKIKPGFDADIVVWDSDPMSAGAAPVQVWIDGTAQYENPVELDKPLEIDFEILSPAPTTKEDATIMSQVIITGITESFLTEVSSSSSKSKNMTAIISDGKITCLGRCTDEISQLQGQNPQVPIIALQNGYLTKPFTAFGSLLGLSEIDAEPSTQNGPSGPKIFSRGLDGLRLDTKKLHYAHKYGVTRAVSAPRYSGLMTHQGTSVGFRTGASHALEKGAVVVEDAAVHYTLDLHAKSGSGSISNAVGELRRNLVGALKREEEEGHGRAEDATSETTFLKKVVRGDLPLVITAHSADTIAAVLRVKLEIDHLAKEHAVSGNNETGINLIILGAAEAHLLAPELAAANVGIVLSPAFSYSSTWDQRRALTGAPLTNGTGIDVLLSHDVRRLALGLEEDWVVRDMGLLAGIALRNSGGRLDERGALNLVSTNVWKMLGRKGEGLEALAEKNMDEFVVFEGSPLDVGSRVRAVADGRGEMSVFEYDE
ncbi:amidohydrolase [Xylariaceae sp. FL0255]|nr:amidohydrolase [Xylariaceae sp. FL0255]